MWEINAAGLQYLSAWQSERGQCIPDEKKKTLPAHSYMMVLKQRGAQKRCANNICERIVGEARKIGGNCIFFIGKYFAIKR